MWLKAISGAVALGLAGCATQDHGVKTRREERVPVRYSQYDYPKAQLGNGGYTISSSGCLLTALTMASCTLHGRSDLDPLEANARIKKRGGFSGSALRLEIAAPALGLVVKGRDALDEDNLPSMNLRLDRELGAERPVVAGVDLFPGRRSSGASAADHFVLIYGKSGERFSIVDPAGGRLSKLERDDDGWLRDEREPKRKVTEMIFLDKSALAR